MQKVRLLFLLAVVVLIVGSISGQTTEFSYQGSLKDGGTAANGNYDFEFALFDMLSGGNQVGPTIARNSVPVANGIFTVKLDFGLVFPGADRYMEIHVRLAGQPGITTLTPRQLIGSPPYSIKALAADAATNAAQLGGVTADQYVLTTDPRMTNARAPIPGDGNYIQNQNADPQATSNFNISGSGTAGGTLSGNVVNAATQYNLGSGRILSTLGGNLFLGPASGQANTTGNQNSFVGSQAGAANTTGYYNSFFGHKAGLSNTSGCCNSIFGWIAGDSNTTGGSNSFFGVDAGNANTTGSFNSFFGTNAGITNTIGSSNTLIGNYANVSGDLMNATAVGANATVSQSNSLVLGSINGLNNATADTNVGIGTAAPSSRLHVVGNGLFTGDLTVNGTSGANIFNAATQYNIGGSRILGNPGNSNLFVGGNAGSANTTGYQNVFTGAYAGESNTTGYNNTFVGEFAGGFFGGSSNTTGSGNSLFGLGANVLANNLTNATAIGEFAAVGASNSLVLGSINGVNGALVDTNVGIGTATPSGKLHVRGVSPVRILGDTITLTGNEYVDFFARSSFFSSDLGGMRIQRQSSGNIDTIFFAAVSGSSSTERMRVTGSGGVGIGTANPDQLLSVNGNASKSAGGTTWAVFSDERLKDVTGRFTRGLDALRQLQPIRFRYKSDNALGLTSGAESVGFSAQAVQKVLPEAVSTNANGYLQLNADPILWTMLNSIKEQQQQIEQQKAQIEALKKIVCSLKPQEAICQE